MKLSWKIYTPKGDYVAACAYPEDAAALVAVLGAGTTVRADHSKAWTCWAEGVDGKAADSYDAAGAAMLARFQDLQRAAYVKQYGEEAYDRALRDASAKRTQTA